MYIYTLGLDKDNGIEAAFTAKLILIFLVNNTSGPELSEMDVQLLTWMVFKKQKTKAIQLTATWNTSEKPKAVPSLNAWQAH